MEGAQIFAGFLPRDHCGESKFLRPLNILHACVLLLDKTKQLPNRKAVSFCLDRNSHDMFISMV